MTAPRDWDAATYERVSAPVAAMGIEVLDRLELAGDETVVDVGCGTGKVTRVLRERLPRGHVIAVDAAPSMVELARSALPPDVEVRQDDALTLSLEEPVDALLSTATLHWIGDHDRLFATLYAALKPGGRLVAQCGGEGNVDELMRVGFSIAAEPPFAEHLTGWQGDWYFPGVADTERRLRAAGFVDVWCWRTRVDTEPPERAGFLRAICFSSFLERLPEDLREPFIDAAIARLPDPLTIHYVRLNILARRPA
jgi:trans-aconitate 2-methyltransferase